jgi:hypothetical protein
MEILSERYGWTPTQIREQSKQDIDAYLKIISERNRLENKKHGKSRP